MTVNPKNKVCEINSHGEHDVTGLQTLLYRPFCDAPKIMFYIGKKSPILQTKWSNQIRRQTLRSLYILNLFDQ